MSKSATTQRVANAGRAEIGTDHCLPPEEAEQEFEFFEAAVRRGFTPMIDIRMPSDVAELWRNVETEAASAIERLARAGLFLIALKTKLGQGQFLKDLTQRGMHPRWAQRAMALARFLLALPPAKQEQLLGLGKSKLALVSQLSPDDLDSLVDELGEHGHADTLSRMTVRELRNEIRKLRKRDTHAREQATTRDERIAALEAENEVLRGRKAAPKHETGPGGRLDEIASSLRNSVRALDSISQESELTQADLLNIAAMAAMMGKFGVYLAHRVHADHPDIFPEDEPPEDLVIDSARDEAIQAMGHFESAATSRH
ncbi:MAG: hypothetical protein GC151_13990 [Betaproteobacteria bacterium]|nr:hypothetical protein [Betaproteobacteria bacterium]